MAELSTNKSSSGVGVVKVILGAFTQNQIKSFLKQNKLVWGKTLENVSTENKTQKAL
jgi:hypothetical protein